MIPQTALISVWDKKGLKKFCIQLQKAGIKIFSTGGTAERIRSAGVPVENVEELTGFVSLIEGRIKTLHTSIYAAILARRDTSDMKELTKRNITPIDMIVCNFYPPGLGMEKMDIGGPCMVRAAAKNWKHVIVISHPSQYPLAINALKQGFDEKLRKKLAICAIKKTAYYDNVISMQEKDEDFPDIFLFSLKKIQNLRYGENPYQKAAFYCQEGIKEPCIATAKKIHGKNLSYNNILDGDRAIECIKEFKEPSVVIIKHATPSGIASAENVEKAWDDAYATDEYSPFGGVVAVNREITQKLAQKMAKIFLEVIIAPSFSNAALKIFTRKKNVRLLCINELKKCRRQMQTEVRSVVGGALIQERNIKEVIPEEWKVVSKKKPSPSDINSMIFAVKCVKHVKSNAVVFVAGTKTVAIGGGQTSRVDASWIATHKGKDNIKGSIMASDAFFPFRDAVDVAVKAGVRAIIQPGGSKRDEEVIESANDYGIAMVFSGQRGFLH